jgi:hypothetical protein
MASGSSSMTVRALEVLLPYAPPSAVALLNNRDRSREQTVITGYATDPPEVAISNPSYQQRVPVNHQLFSRRGSRLLPARLFRIMEDYVRTRDGARTGSGAGPGWPCLVISGHGNYAGLPWGVFLGSRHPGGGCLPMIAASRARYTASTRSMPVSPRTLYRASRGDGEPQLHLAGLPGQC